MLPFRPQINLDECLVSYLIRVSENNGFKHIGRLLHYAGLSWRNSRIPVHRIITGEFDVSGYLLALGLRDCEFETAKMYRTFRRVIDTNHVFVKYPKVCPVCLSEKGYCKFQWAYLSVLSCCEHNTMLVDVQKETGERLSWYRQKLDKFASGSAVIGVTGGPVVQPAAYQLTNYIESLITNGAANITVPTILNGLVFRDALTLINFLALYHARLLGVTFKPVSMENSSLAQHYLDVWKMLQDWPDSFYTMLDQYIDHPVSDRGVSGINKHYRNLYECLYRQQDNQGIARIKTEFDSYIENYWPGIIEADRITRICLTSPIRGIVSKKEAAKLIGCRPERIDKLIQLEKLNAVIFKGKAHYLRDEVEDLGNLIVSNWSMAEACKALQVTRYQLKQLLDAGTISFIQKPDQLNRDWIVDKARCRTLVEQLFKSARSGKMPNNVMSMAGIQRQGYSIVRLISSMQTGKMKYGVCVDVEYPDSLKQFIEFKANDST